MSDNENNFDVSKFSYEEFLQFFFDRRILGEEEFFPTAFCPEDADIDDVSDPRKVVANLQKLFTEFRSVGERFSLQQINQGIWAIVVIFNLERYIWLKSVPLTERLECIRSMRIPYCDFVAGHPVEMMEGCFYMWWDIVCGSFWSRPIQYIRYPQFDDENKAILDTMFETLCAILALNDWRCKDFALHGLGHLHHPNVHQTVQDFIDTHRDECTLDGIKWLEECRDGIVM